MMGGVDEDPAEYGCVLAFDTDDPQFVRGFEAGRVWALLHLEDEQVDVEMHAANAEIVMRLAEATGRTVISTELGDEWLNVKFGAAAPMESPM